MGKQCAWIWGSVKYVPALPCGRATKNTSHGSFRAASNTMVLAFICSVLSQRKIGGIKSKVTLVVGQREVPSWPTSAVSATPALPARSVKITLNVMHPFWSTKSLSPGSTTLGPMHHVSPPPTTAPSGNGPNPVKTVVGALIGSLATTQSVIS
jgi:hypothetical protein